MTNKDFSPRYSGMSIVKILDKIEATGIRIDSGTVLVQEIDSLNLMFQTKWDICFTSSIPSLEILEGSGIYTSGEHLTDRTRIVVNFGIRIPHDEELEWYDKQNLV